MKKYRINKKINLAEYRTAQCVRELRGEGFRAWIESDNNGNDVLLTDAPLALILFCAGSGVFCTATD